MKEIEVVHRPRLKGVSKYGAMNRLWVGIWDILGMLWFRTRHIPSRRLSDQ